MNCEITLLLLLLERHDDGKCSYDDTSNEECAVAVSDISTQSKGRASEGGRSAHLTITETLAGGNLSLVNTRCTRKNLHTPVTALRQPAVEPFCERRRRTHDQQHYRDSNQGCSDGLAQVLKNPPVTPFRVSILCEQARLVVDLSLERGNG